MIPSKMSEWLERFRIQLARADAVLPLSLLGLIAGILAALTVIALRLLVDGAQTTLYPMAQAGDFESLPWHWRLGIALAGGLLVGMLFRLVPGPAQTVGVLHVIERLAYHQGRLPWINAVVQFFGGAISMIAGHSVGREGPSAHLGAASSNLPAQALGLPHNSLRVLTACGTAAGIAASFNTPLAGAVFAMEVLMLEYTVAGFAPVILATVSATAISQLVFGDTYAFSVPELHLSSVTQLPYILVCGILIGLLAAGFNALFQQVVLRSQRLPDWSRPVLAGLLVGICGLFVPEVMGIGDDTVNAILSGETALQLLLVVLIVKVLATTGGIGLGLPGGLIGPTFFIGAAAGGLLGAVGIQLGFIEAGSVGLYAMIGMGAMMAATLQAPMAGLIAILELTGEPNFILPGMLAVVTSTIVSGRLFRRESLFHTLLRDRGLDYRSDPVARTLRRVGVASAMNRRIVVLPRQVEAEQVDRALQDEPVWVLIQEEEPPQVALAGVDLAYARKQSPDAGQFDLMELPGERRTLVAIDMRATMEEARQHLHDSGKEMAYVISQNVPGLPRIYGVLSRDEVEGSYRY
ncbi:MAG: chloride channel protein [Thiohalophilus sp.]|uniref:chloride channel protein n=1 Tax=Thiohalophilus sp. TaxID=3028392 RepID=UPI00286FF26C|nr:chloride channel protein [Thiohalophilus sp.]MDR9437534.1 chloride channel protein [Thiohalophilus sp.]